MKKFPLVILFCISSITIKAQISVGYINGYYDSYPESAIDYSNLNYIAMSFIYPQANGSISVDSWFLNPQLVQTAHQHGVEVVVSVGGYGGSDSFSPMVADTAARTKFVKNLVDFCLQNNFDGADLDWEYPKSTDRANFTALVIQIRKAFNDANISTLSAAIPSQDWNNAYDIAQLKNYLNWFGIMTYDFYGPWETTSGHDAALYSSSKQYSSIDNSVKYYTGKGMPKDKMCIGIPFGGYTLNTKALFTSCSGGTTISYVDANTKKNQGWTYHWDEICKQPYLQNQANTQLITYDDTNSVKLKCEYIHKNNLMGTIVWKIGRDYDGKSTPLLSMLGKYLLNYPVNIPATPILQTPQDEEKNDSTSLQFTWLPTDSTTSYQLQVSTQKDFNSLTINKDNINMNYYIISGLKSNTTYYWRVNASNLNGTSSWSDTRSFTTKDITLISNDDEKQVPQKYFLANYPNPFNPSTTIRYSIPKDNLVKISVYSILGTKIKTLVDKIQHSGNYEIKFEGQNLPSGIYLYRLQAGEYSKINKMLLLK